MDSGSMHHFVGADSSCISWGLAQSGELGYGPHGQKYVTLLSSFYNACHLYLLIVATLFCFYICRSSAIPKKVEALEGMHVLRSVLDLLCLLSSMSTC